MKKKYNKPIRIGAAASAVAAIALFIGAINKQAAYEKEKQAAYEKEKKDLNTTIMGNDSKTPALIVDEATLLETAKKTINDSCAILTRESTGDSYAILNSADIGRAGYNDVQIADMHVSRFHCRIFQHDNVYYIVDLKATTKAKLNGKPIDEKDNIYAYPLKDDDKITVGPEVFTFNTPEDINMAKNIGNVDTMATLV